MSSNSEMMQLERFDYPLPTELIAQYPLANRTASRLLNVSATEGELSELCFDQLDTLCSPEDLLVVNNTRVLPARMLAKKPTGGKVEIMLERILTDNTALVMLGANKPIKIGQVLLLEQDETEVIGRENQFFVLSFNEKAQDVFQRHGEMPIPPYIERKVDEDDQERYQTVYSANLGAVAAPTAGLHFDRGLIDRLTSKGVNWGEVTLHVGAGTFQPVRETNIENHEMHKEYIQVDASVCEKIRETKKRGGKVIAVGTTVVRALESAAVHTCNSPEKSEHDELMPFYGDSDLFIFPGFRFRVVDELITNFHLPKSTLLMMVSAFAGYENVMKAYQFAIDNRFRFFSYGDAMYLRRAK